MDNSTYIDTDKNDFCLIPTLSCTRITLYITGPNGAYIRPGVILGLRPASERLRYKVTPSLIGWVQTYNQPCMPIYIGSSLAHTNRRWLSHQDIALTDRY